MKKYKKTKDNSLNNLHELKQRIIALEHENRLSKQYSRIRMCIITNRLGHLSLCFSLERSDVGTIPCGCPMETKSPFSLYIQISIPINLVIR